MKILLIEPDTAQQSAITLHLNAHGYSVTSAASAYEALETLLGDTPDLVICSITLPDAPGITLLHNIRGVQGLECANLPFILTYSQMSGEEWMQALRMDVEHFIPKHSAPAALTQAIRDIANGNTQAATLAQAKAAAEFMH